MINFEKRKILGVELVPFDDRLDRGLLTPPAPPSSTKLVTLALLLPVLHLLDLDSFEPCCSDWKPVVTVLALQAPSVPGVVGGLRQGTAEDAVKYVQPCQCPCHPHSHLCTIGSSQCDTAGPVVPCGGGSFCGCPPGIMWG